MPRDKTVTHIKVLAAAREEFMEYGYENASMRRIRQRCDMTAAGMMAGQKIDSDERVVEKVLEYLQGMAEVKAYHLTGTKSRELNDAIAANVKVNSDMELTLIPRMSAQNLIAKLTGCVW